MSRYKNNSDNTIDAIEAITRAARTGKIQFRAVTLYIFSQNVILKPPKKWRIEHVFPKTQGFPPLFFHKRTESSMETADQYNEWVC